MTDQEWMEAAKAKFDYPNPILPCFYTAEAWKRHLAGRPYYKWQDGDLDREKTKAGLADMGLNVEGL